MPKILPITGVTPVPVPPLHPTASVKGGCPPVFKPAPHRPMTEHHLLHLQSQQWSLSSLLSNLENSKTCFSNGGALLGGEHSFIMNGIKALRAEVNQLTVLLHTVASFWLVRSQWWAGPRSVAWQLSSRTSLLAWKSGRRRLGGGGWAGSCLMVSCACVHVCMCECVCVPVSVGVCVC